MVSIEPQHTHMSFEGLCDVLGALGAELVPRKVEGRQCPDSKKYIRGGTQGIFLYLLALGEEGSDNVCLVAF